MREDVTLQVVTAAESTIAVFTDEVLLDFA